MINCYFYRLVNLQTGLMQLNNLSRYIFILLLTLLYIKGAAGAARQPAVNKADSAIISQKNQEINQLMLKQQRADNVRLLNEIKIKEQSITFAKRLFWIRNVIALCVVALSCRALVFSPVA